MAVKTNMLYDVLAVPNIGVEFYLGKGWTLGGNWMYGWWDKGSKHRYWRVYGGDIAVRKWLGKRAAGKPLTGHHLGVYGQVFTYDFEWGGTGYMGGEPGRDTLGQGQLCRGRGIRLLPAGGTQAEHRFHYRRGLLGRQILYLQPSRWA